MVRSRRDAIAEAKRLGINVEPVRRTGEVRFRSPLTGDTVTHDIRRKDASRAVEKLIDRHYRRMVGPTDEEGDA